MKRARQVLSIAGHNFSSWHKNPRVFMTFALAAILCFLLSDKAVRFAQEYETLMQIGETFVWTFGDSNSILLSSLLLILLFIDMPFLDVSVPFMLYRVRRSTWLLGQMLYIGLATFFYMVFVLVMTVFFSMHISFSGNQWSETAAMLGFSGAGRAIAIPALVKTLEMSRPYECMGVIFLLMLLYMLLMMTLMFFFTIARGSFWGVGSVLGFSIFGFLLNPQLFKTLLQIEDDRMMYIANLWAAWLSPLQHATYHMHNFGYDMLPRLWMTYCIFGGLILLFSILSYLGIRKYNFNFIGYGG